MHAEGSRKKDPGGHRGGPIELHENLMFKVVKEIKRCPQCLEIIGFRV